MPAVHPFMPVLPPFLGLSQFFALSGLLLALFPQ